MHQRGHDDNYRAAFLAASAELNEIFSEVQRLRIRKDQVEKVVEAITPLLDAQAPSYELELATTPFSSEPAQFAAEFAPAPAPVAAAPGAPRNESPAPGDAIQRRIDSILGLAVA